MNTSALSPAPLTALPPPTRQAEPRLVQVAHGHGGHFAGTACNPGGRDGGHSFGAEDDIVDRAVIQPPRDTMHLCQLREGGEV